MPTPYLAPMLQEQGYTGATGTTPYKPATTQQVDALKGLYNNSSAANTPQVVSFTATVININFDGTKNNGEFPASGESATNVYELSKLQMDANGKANTIYLPGVGAQIVRTGTLDANGNPAPGSSPSNWDSIPSNAGGLANGIVERAYQQLSTRVTAILADNPNAEISLNLSGFSRGGAQAVAFANYVNERGIPGLYEAGQVPIDSMVLFDPVDQTSGQLNTAPPINVKSTLVMVAENEGRAIMPVMPVGPDATVVLVPGAHADVGGSFNPDGVAAVTLKMARDFQEKSGVPVAQIPAELAPNWEQMNVHNSGLDNYGNTVWSFNENYRSYEGAGFRSPSVVDAIRNGLPYGPIAENPAAGDAIDYKVPADPSQPDGPQLTVREVTDRNGNSTLTVRDADGRVVMNAAPGDTLVRDPGTGQFTLTNGVDGQTITYNPDAFVPNTLTNFLSAQGSSLTPAQQSALALQVNSLGLGGESGLSFYSLPGGGALIANADGDIVGEVNLHSATGSLNLRATAIDAEGNAVEVSQHIQQNGAALTEGQYNAQVQQQAANMFNSLMAVNNWDNLSDLGKFSALANLYNAADNLGEAFSATGNNLPGDLGAAAGWLSLAQGLQSGDDLIIANGINIISNGALDSALNQAFGNTAAGQSVPYLSYALAIRNFAEDPVNAIFTAAGSYAGEAIGMAFGGPIGAAIGGVIGGMIGGMLGGLFGDDDIPMREGLAHAQWDASGHTQVLTTQDAEGGGATAHSWMSSLVNGLQANLHQAVDANGQPQYGLIPDLLPSVGFQYDPDGFNLTNGARGFMYLQWTDEAGQTQTRYYDGAGSRGDGSGETLAGDFMAHAQDAIAPAWQVQTVLAHFQQSGEIDLPKQTHSLPTELADGLQQSMQVVSLALSSTMPTEAAPSSKWIDVDGDGYLEKTQWLQSNQAILSVDLNGDEMISAGERVNLQDAAQVQYARTSMGWLDANGDGRLTERADGSPQDLTVQDLTVDTLGVALQQTAGGMVETTEPLDGTGAKMLRTCRSTWAIKVRCNSTSKAQSSCDHPSSARRRTMLSANTSRAQMRCLGSGVDLDTWRFKASAKGFKVSSVSASLV